MLNNDEYTKMYTYNKFKCRAQKQYRLQDNLIYDDRILLLLYTYEWFKIPKDKKFELALNHPYMTKNDIEILKHLQSKYFLMLATFNLVIYLSSVNIYAYKIINKPKRILFKLKIIFPTLALSSYLWNSIFIDKMSQEVDTISELNKYMNLDVDLEKVIKELVNYNIKLI